MEATAGELFADRSVDGVDGRTHLEHELAGLRLALESRDVIGQAKGMLMERYGLDADRAFEVLVRLSQDSNVKLRRIAEDFVRTRELPA